MPVSMAGCRLLSCDVGRGLERCALEVGAVRAFGSLILCDRLAAFGMQCGRRQYCVLAEELNWDCLCACAA